MSVKPRRGVLPPIGSFSFVFHSHIPYVRQAGRWPHGEEWVHEATAETYIPLLCALNRLHQRGLPAQLTLSLTPILLEQLADHDVQANFLAYMENRIALAEQDVQRFGGAEQPHLAYLAEVNRDWHEGILRSFTEDFCGDLIGAFRDLQDAGVIEVVTCAATHGYLPLLDRDESIRLQLRAAVESHKRHLGVQPRGIWLPECAYRPAYRAEGERQRPGLEILLADQGLSFFFAETHMIEGGAPVGMAEGKVLGPYGAIKRRYAVPFSESSPPQPATTFQPYHVGGAEVAVVGRENRTGMQVWSADWGYPGEYDYREFHKKDSISGMRYWRVTGEGVDLAGKDQYHPDWAAEKVKAHAQDFAELVTRLLEGYHRDSGAHGLVCAMYDTELFGHWWFEGIAWIESVLERLAISDQVELTSVGRFLEQHPPEGAIHLPEGSWGAGGTHFVWDNGDNHWMWPLVHAAEARMAEAVRRWPEAPPPVESLLNQAARELLLLQASDWPFLISTGQAKNYATQRFQTHLDRYNALLDSAMSDQPDPQMAQAHWERDRVFPAIDYRWFAQ